MTVEEADADILPFSIPCLLPEQGAGEYEESEMKWRILRRQRSRPAEHIAPRCPAGFCEIGSPKARVASRLIGFRVR